jgi:phosphomannomutase/phosphoglucomutase
VVKVSPHIFKEHEIRGSLKKDFTATKTKTLGRALAQFFEKIFPEEELIVASGQSLEAESIHDLLVEELLQAGVLMVDLGQIPTPLFFYAPHDLEYGNGILVESNSDGTISLTIVSDGQVVFGHELQLLAKLAKQRTLWSLKDPGRIRKGSVMVPYMRMLRQKLKFAKDLKIVVDCAHRPDAFFVTYLFTSLGCQVVSLASDDYQTETEPAFEEDERLKILGDVVKREKAQVGFFFPIRGERLLVVDEKGKVVPTEKLMLLFLRELLAEHPKAEIAVPDDCPGSITGEIERLGGTASFLFGGPQPFRAAKTGAIFGGDRGDQFFFADEYYGYADAYYGAGRLIRLLSREDKPLSRLLPRIRKSKKN